MGSGIYFDLLGYYALGIFVGTIAAQPLRFADDADASVKAIASVLPAALAGTAVTFLQIMDKAEHGMAAYAIGLLIALLWVVGFVAMRNLEAENRFKRDLGVLHIVAVSLISVFATLLFIPAAGIAIFL